LARNPKKIIKKMTSFKKKICVITGSRAEYGILKNLIYKLKKSKKIKLQLVVTGMHLSLKHGLTYKEIVEDGFKITRKIKILKNSDSERDVSNFTSDGIKKFSQVFNKIKPNLILVLGDRFEVFAGVIAAMFARIPIGHIHGGETTEGAIDEAIRHSITKMSHLHFVSTGEYKKRVEQLGEFPKNVYLTGGMGVDTIKKTKLLKKNILEKKINFNFGKKNILVNFHPVTLEKNTSKVQIKEILSALKILKNTKIIFSMPNADHDSKVIFREIKNFVRKNKNSKSYKSLGSLNYLSCLKIVDVILGNSSSGLLEAPTLRVPTINIGDRQKGRTKANSVIDCKPKKKKILKKLKKILDNNLFLRPNDFKNPYGNGGASEKIVNILEKIDYNSLLKKKFYKNN